MKKIKILTTLTLATILFTGCGSQQAKMSYIGIETAKATALEAAGFSDTEVTFTTTKLTERNGQEYYDIDFSIDDQQYAYDIDAFTGVVIDYQNSQEAQVPEETSLVPETTTAPPTPKEEPTTIKKKDDLISKDRARELALSHAGLTKNQVTFIKSGLDFDDGRKVYDIEFHTDDYTEYDYDIDAVTGEILSFDADAEYYTTPPRNTDNSSDKITEAEAKKIALSQVPGATKDDIREFEVDYDDGRLAYEGKIYYDSMEYEFEIDGYSGAIRNWEVESIYD